MAGVYSSHSEVFSHSSGSTSSSIQPSKSRKDLGRFGHYFHLLLEAVGRQSHNLLLAPSQLHFWDAFSSPSLALMATHPSPSAHQMVLSVLVNPDLIWAFSCH